MKLTVLGVNGPFPAPGGACSGYLLESDSGNTRLLFDCGAGILARLTRYTSIDHLTGIVLTHLHFDHMSDMLVLQYMLQFTKLERNIPVIAPDEPETIHMMLDNDKLDFIKPRDMNLGEMRLTFIPAVHPVPAVSVKAECDGTTFVYTGDTNVNTGIEFLCDGANLLLADAGLTQAQWSPNAPHLSARLCGKLAKDSRAGSLVLTHIRPGNDPEALLDEARTMYPAAQLAKAGATYIV